MCELGSDPASVHAVDGHATIWITSGEPALVIRAHRPWSPEATAAGSDPISGLAALTAAARPEPSDDPVGDLEANIAWVHQCLLGLTGRVPVPSPAAVFSGESWLRVGDVVWEAVSFVPGEVIGDRPVPSLDAVGAFLARYHQESALLTLGERPASTPVDRLSSIVDWSRAAAMSVNDGVPRLRAMLDRLRDDLLRIGYTDLPSCVLHGDPTSHNMLARGAPPRPCGLIDFDLAHHGAAAADIAFGLWRTGRPAPNDHRVDPRRVQEFVAGYCRVRPLSMSERTAIPIYLRARGLQMLVKRTRLGIDDNGPLRQVQWIEAHHDALARAVAGD
jgi:Ser/Thr protein kinase RdoA (MazF antagonist)